MHKNAYKNRIKTNPQKYALIVCYRNYGRSNICDVYYVPKIKDTAHGL